MSICIQANIQKSYQECFNQEHQEILLLQSTEGYGKTTSINLLYNLMIDIYALPETLKRKNIEKDLRETLTLNGIKVAFCSEGDIGEYIDRNVKEYNLEENRFIIGACRTKGSSVNAWWDFATNKKYHISYYDYCSPYDDKDYEKSSYACRSFDVSFVNNSIEKFISHFH